MSLNDLPYSEDSSINPELKAKIEPILKKLTVSETKSLGNYILDCARKHSKNFEENVTIKDFQKAHKQKDDTNDDSSKDDYTD